MRKRLPLIVVVITALVLSGTALGVSHLPDTDGIPDLVVDQKVLQNHWLVRDEGFLADDCAAQEGGISAGEHRVLRFAVSTPNIGTADVALGDPNAHVAADDGLYEFATCHRHFHFRHYATYELLSATSNKVWRAAKRGFCMIDVVPGSQAYEGPQKTWTYRSCGRIGIPGNQGISVGWSDEYWTFLDGQYFVMDGGDGQEAIPPGQYRIRITVNPPYPDGLPGEKAKCNKDTNGFCHLLEESDYTNNVATSLVNVPDHPGRDGWGPAKGETEPKPDKGFNFVLDEPK